MTVVKYALKDAKLKIAGQEIPARCPSTGEVICMMCSNEACNKCGAGCWDETVTDCNHDVIERHEK